MVAVTQSVFLPGSDSKVVEMVEISGALSEDHYLLASGQHSPYYIDLECLLRDKDSRRELAKIVARMIWVWSGRERFDFDGLIGLESWANLLALDVAEEFEALAKVRLLVITAKKDEMRSFYFNREAAALISGKRWIIIDDVFSTGSSVLKVWTLIKLNAGVLRAVAVVVSRCIHLPPALGALPALLAPATIELPSYKPPCELCDRGIPLLLTPRRLA